MNFLKGFCSRQVPHVRAHLTSYIMGFPTFLGRRRKKQPRFLQPPSNVPRDEISRSRETLTPIYWITRLTKLKDITYHRPPYPGIRVRGSIGDFTYFWGIFGNHPIYNKMSNEKSGECIRCGSNIRSMPRIHIRTSWIHIRTSRMQVLSLIQDFCPGCKTCP